MRIIAFVSIVSALASSGWAQQSRTDSEKPSHAPSVIRASARDIVEALNKIAAEQAVSQRPTQLQSIVRLEPYNVVVERRIAAGPASVHDHQAELIFVLDGAATLVTGGTLKQGKRANAGNQTGTGIEGGSAQEIGKGDVVMVPEGVPHWISAVNGTVSLIGLHLPRTPTQ